MPRESGASSNHLPVSEPVLGLIEIRWVLDRPVKPGDDSDWKHIKSDPDTAG